MPKTAGSNSSSDASSFNFFLPIAKVDKARRQVSGYASTPALDMDGEVVSLEAVKKALPGYWEWRNIREMHRPSAVGVAKEANVDEKGLFLTAKVSDDVAWQKCLDEVYKGFSIGGRKLNKSGNTITEIELVEISLVDRPANPECKFEVQKSAKAGAGTASLVKARRESNSSPENRALRKMARAVEILSKSNPPAAHDGFSLPAKPVEKSDSGSDPCAKHGMVNCEKCAAKAAKKVQKREVKQKERQQLAHEGKALPGGGFPIKNKKDLANARQAIGRAKNPGAARQLIRTRARQLGVQLPASWSKKLAKALIAEAEFQSLNLDLAKSAQPSFLTLGADDVGTSTRVLDVEGVDGLGHGFELGQGNPFGLPLLEGDGSGARAGSEDTISKSMSTAGQLSYCFDTLRSAQRSLMMEAKREGGDQKDKALAREIGSIAKQLAEVIGQKAAHEGQEATDLSDADDQGWDFNLEEGMGKTLLKGVAGVAGASDDLIAKWAAGVLSKAAKPSRVQRMNIARGNLKKAGKAMKDLEECIKSAHAMHKAAYVAKMAKAAGKKPKADDGDDDDMDKFDHVGAMQKLQKAYNDLTSIKTFVKASSVQLKKAASRSGQRGQQPSDGEPGFYSPPAGITNLTPAELATALPGTKGSGGEPPIQRLDENWSGKSAKVRKALERHFATAGGSGLITAEHAEALAKAAAAEAKVEVLERQPAIGGRKPLAFDTTQFFGKDAGVGNSDAEKVALKGINVKDFESPDENKRQGAWHKMIGNTILGNQGRPIFDPEFSSGVLGRD